jgi:hypothetical protein
MRGILGQRALGDLGKHGGSVRTDGGQRGRRFLELAAKDFDGARRFERKPPRQHPVEDDPERVDVGRRRHLFALRLLGRHVRGRSHQGARIGERIGAGHAGDTEVGDLGATLLVEDDVRRLQVTMDQAPVMRVCKAGSDLSRDPLALRVIQRLPPGEPVFQRAPGEVLEDHVPPSVRPSVVEESADVRVGERCDRLGLALEALGVGVCPEQLQRDLPVELGVVRQPHLPHSANAELLLETVSAADRLAHIASSL